MLQHGKINCKNNDTVYSDTYDYGVSKEEMRLVSSQAWLDLEQEFYNGTK